MSSTPITVLRAVAAGSTLALLGAAGAAGIAHAAPDGRAAGASKASIESIFPVPHSSLTYGLTINGSRHYLVAGSNGPFKKAWSPKLGGKNGHLDSVYAVSKHNVFIGGGIGIPTPGCSGCENSKVEIWHKVGNKVTPVNFKKYNFGTGGVTVNGFAGSSPKDIWAIGSFYQNDTGGPQAMHWNGRKWSLVEVPQDANYTGLTSIAAISPNDAWAVRAGDNNGADGDVLHWDGKTWTDTGQVLNETSGGSYISGNSAKNVYLSGINAKGKNAIDKYNGKKWVPMKVKGWPASSVVTALSTVGKQGWALVAYRNAKNEGQAIILHTSGGTWKPEWKSHGGDWEFGSAFEVSSASRGLFIGAHNSGGYDSPEHSFALRMHGHHWKLGTYSLK